MTTSLLDRVVYDTRSASQLLQVPAATLNWWLNGRTDRGRHHLPVLRDQINDDRLMTWGEFVSADVLRTLRRRHRVKLDEIRVFCHHLRATTGVSYPLAQREILINGSRLVKAAALAGLDDEVVVTDSTGHVIPGPAVKMFVERVQWENGEVVSVQIDEHHPLVHVDPRIRAGRPQVQGVATDAVYELYRAGDPIEYIAEMWRQPIDVIRAAIDFEETATGVVAA